MLHPARKMQHSREAVIRAHRQRSGGSLRGACLQAWPWSGSTLACGTLTLRPHRSHRDAAQPCDSILAGISSGAEVLYGNGTTIILSTAGVHRVLAAECLGAQHSWVGHFQHGSNNIFSHAPP